MQQCPQTNTQSVYQHGVSVWEYTQKLIHILRSGEKDSNWILPDWLFTYRHHILEKLLPLNIIEEYTVHHDCGKILCLEYDDNGNRHFANHAELSYQTWLKIGGDQTAAELMKMDMLMHTINVEEAKTLSQHPYAITLLIVGLCELHSNAAMFGGITSTSFKIKYKKLERNGKTIIKQLFGDI